MSNNNPIGVFDSGMGGLSVWRELKRELPNESFVYYGDGANCPYGEKDPEEVTGFIDQGVRTLIGKGAKMIVLACNTATVLSIRKLRESYDIPFVGMEPAVKPAVNTSGNGVVGVLATRGTLESEWFAQLKSRYGEKAEIVTAEGVGFVGLVENDLENTPEAVEAVRRSVGPLIGKGVDKIVLGCTHYPFLGELIRGVAGPDVEIIDPAPAIVKRVKWLLDELSLHAANDHKPEYSFLTAADNDYLNRLQNKALSR